MKKFNWIALWLLPNVTFGIYGLYANHVMTKNLNAMAETCGKKKIMGYIPAWLLGFVTFGIFPIYWFYTFFNLQVELAKEKNVELKPVDNPWLLLLISCVPIYSFYVICDNHNKLVDAA